MDGESEQCDQMTTLLFHYLAIDSKVNFWIRNEINQAQNDAKYYIDHLNQPKSWIFFCQSGEISPNLVTLGMRERGWVGGLEVPKVGLVFLTLKFGSIFRVVFFSVKLTLLQQLCIIIPTYLPTYQPLHLFFLSASLFLYDFQIVTRN